MAVAIEEISADNCPAVYRNRICIHMIDNYYVIWNLGKGIRHVL